MSFRIQASRALSMRREPTPVTLGVETFPSKKAAAKRITTLLWGCSDGEILDTDERALALALLLRHPDAQALVGTGLASIFVAKSRGRLSLWTEDARGEQKPFNWKICLSAPSWKKLLAAARSLVGDASFATTRIFREFLEEHGLPWEEIGVKEGQIQNDAVCHLWKVFYAKKARS